MRIIACFAATLDGKIADKTHPGDRVGSKADLAHLLAVRSQADAILCGGETFREFPRLRHDGQAETGRMPIQCLLTRCFNLPPEARLFPDSLKHDPPVPVWVFSPTPAPPDVWAHYPANVEWLSPQPASCPGPDKMEGAVDSFSDRDLEDSEASIVPYIIETLEQRGVKTLLIEGGGHVMHAFLQAHAVQELYLTLCPLLLGGLDDPSLVSGLGFTVAEAPRTEVITADWRGQELYLHLKIKYSSVSIR